MYSFSQFLQNLNIKIISKRVDDLIKDSRVQGVKDSSEGNKNSLERNNFNDKVVF